MVKYLNNSGCEMAKEKTFATYTFGCKVNQEETAGISGLFVAHGWQELKFGEASTLYIINTCTVTQLAERKARSLIRRIIREHPQTKVVVCGCYAQTAAEEIRNIPGVAIIAGVEERSRLPQIVDEYMSRQRDVPYVDVADLSNPRPFTTINDQSNQRRARAYLKIEDGCNCFCHYCIVPYARGRVRSLPWQQALEQGKKLIAQGHKEIVLTGIHIGAYGSDLDDGSSIPRITKAFTAENGLVRIRFGSIEPQQVDDQILQLLQEEKKLCPHLHIPLQSGCDKTLAAMGRRYDSRFYADLLRRLRKIIPDIAITTDMIVGFPGESDEDFNQSLDFAAQMGFAKIHVFPYSRRKGTVAAALPEQLLRKTKEERAAQLAAVGEKSARQYAELFIGCRLQMLVEQPVEYEGKNCYNGTSENYLSLILPEIAQKGEIISVFGKKYSAGSLIVAGID